MTRTALSSTAALWARFRFAVVGALLSSPPPRGALKIAIGSLAEKTWSHPITGREVRLSAVTIERWYYKARRQRDDPVAVLRRAVRKDCGKVSLDAPLAERLMAQYGDHPHWSYQLHYDNLAALVKADPSLGTLRSYSTVRRYMQRTAGRPGRSPGPTNTPARPAPRRDVRRARSAATRPNTWERSGISISTTDRSRCSRPPASGSGRSRWASSTTTRGSAATSSGTSPRPPKTSCTGSRRRSRNAACPVRCSPITARRWWPRKSPKGCFRLGIVHERTLPYSPYQNGKQEAFWGTLEGRLMKMLDGVADLTLDLLNEATQAWMEIEYNRTVHRETASSPVERFAHAPDVLRDSPSSHALRDAFRLETTRRQRQSDGTISLEGVRFEVPGRYRHFREVAVRYARWDLGRVDLIDPRNGTILAPLYPLDKTANADGRRARFEAGAGDPPADGGARKDGALPPLLKRILDEYSATGLPPAYLPKTSPPRTGDRS